MTNRARYFIFRTDKFPRVSTAATDSLFVEEFDKGDRREWDEVKVVPMDAIVILPHNLPEVSVDSGGYEAHGAGAFVGKNNSAPADEAERRALGYLAIAHRLRKNPPVDEAQVDAVLRVLEDVIDGADRETAVDLVRAGLRAEKKES